MARLTIVPMLSLCYTKANKIKTPFKVQCTISNLDIFIFPHELHWQERHWKVFMSTALTSDLPHLSLSWRLVRAALPPHSALIPPLPVAQLNVSLLKVEYSNMRAMVRNVPMCWPQRSASKQDGWWTPPLHTPTHPPTVKLGHPRPTSVSIAPPTG